MLTNPDLVEARKDLKTARGENPLVAQVKLKANDELHFNIAGGKIEAGSKIVMFHTH